MTFADRLLRRFQRQTRTPAPLEPWSITPDYPEVSPPPNPMPPLLKGKVYISIPAALQDQVIIAFTDD